MSEVSVVRVTGVRAVELNVTDLERSFRFYTEKWRLDIVAEETDACYLRASGPEHHVLVLRRAEEAGLRGITFAVASPNGIDQLYARLRERGEATKPAELTTPGGGYGFSVADRYGRTWALVSGVERHVVRDIDPDRPSKISHVVLNSAEPLDDLDFAVAGLGFRLRDESKAMLFLGCNPDHHSLAIAKSGKVGLNHIAYEVSSIDAVMRNVGRLKRVDVPLQWGVGRHGPGANVYSYYLDPDDVPIEYTAELLQVDDSTYRPGGPADWERPPFYDAWGVAGPPTQQFLEASAR